ncbi:unnamed protein product [Lymnaea stagnalis]|uniref:Uncharacterized protein n=1 Tax=Lymnaea stagnalis TaxID=6523 RepID=A0AAV2HDR5_LYMST
MPEVIEHVTSQLCREKFWSKKKKVIKITVATAIMLVILCLSAVVVYHQLNKGKQRSKDILKKYGHLFVKVNDMASTEINLKLETVDVPEGTFEMNETCTLSCSANGTDRNDTEKEPKIQRQKENKIRYHGCCASYPQYFSPNTLLNGLGVVRRLVQFKSTKQIFLQDVCSHIKGCTRGCTCRQQKIRTQALVIDYDGTEIEPPHENDMITFANARLELVEYPGFCKCYN